MPEGPHRVLPRLAVLVLVVAALGLPINTLYAFGLLAAAVLVVFTGSVDAQRRALARRDRADAAGRRRARLPAGAAHRGRAQRLPDRRTGQRAGARPAARGLSRDGGALRCRLPGRAALHRRRRLLLAHERHSEAGLRVCGRRHLRSSTHIRGASPASISRMPSGCGSASSTTCRSTWRPGRATSSACSATAARSRSSGAGSSGSPIS